MMSYTNAYICAISSVAMFNCFSWSYRRRPRKKTMTPTSISLKVIHSSSIYHLQQMYSDSSSVVSANISSEITTIGAKVEQFDSFDTMLSLVETLWKKNIQLEEENRKLKGTKLEKHDVMPFLHTEEQSLNDEISRFQRKFKNLKQELIKMKTFEFDSSSNHEMKNYICDWERMYEIWEDVSKSMREAAQKAIRKIGPQAATMTIDESKDKKVSSGKLNKIERKTTSLNEKTAERIATVFIHPKTEKLCNALCGEWKHNSYNWHMTIEKTENGFYRETVSYNRAESIWRPDDVTRENKRFFPFENKIISRKFGSTHCEQYESKQNDMLMKTVTFNNGARVIHMFTKMNTD